MDALEKVLLEQIADLHNVPAGAYNIRSNSRSDGRKSTDNIQIVTKDDLPGIDIIIKENTKNESVHIPALVTKSGIQDLVYNDFYIGENSDVLIVAGCGIHNDGTENSEHIGIHRFFVGKNAKMRYVEKHIGSGNGNGERIINPETVIVAEEGSSIEIETTQIKGVDSTVRITSAVLKEGATLVIKEKLMTHGKQYAESSFSVDLDGDDSSVSLVSRAVAKGKSKQIFISKISGNAKCSGHSECDAIIMDNSIITATPELTANHVDAQLIHEAAIGKIAGEQIIKLMTMGLSEQEAEAQIISGFLK